MNIYFSTSPNHTLQLLDHALTCEFGITVRPEISRTTHGKPYFTDSDVHFNYSHCKYGSACVIAKHEVGVDVQEICAIKPSVIKRVCCDNELKVIQNDDDFIKMWTLKEAYAKFTGKGFAEGFKTIDTTKFSDKLVLKYDNLYIAYYAERFEEELKLVQVAPP